MGLAGNGNRRQLLKTSLGWAGAAVLLRSSARAAGFREAVDRPKVGAVGTGSRWCQKATGINGPWGSAPDFRRYGDYVAVCDADSSRRELAAGLVREWGASEVSQTADYRRILDDPGIDIVHISTPDHWHAKILVEAMLAGKDVYCEKPMTLTIPEGRLICDVCSRTGRIVQIGTQQRSESQFLTAIALIQHGRLGQLRKATCRIGGARKARHCRPLPLRGLWTGISGRARQQKRSFGIWRATTAKRKAGHGVTMSFAGGTSIRAAS